MPDWTRNKIVCKKAIGDKILSKTENGYCFDFNKLIPMPRSLQLISGTIENVAVASYYLSLSKKEQSNITKLLKDKKPTYDNSYWNKYKNTINRLSDNSKLLKREEAIFQNNDFEDNYKKFDSLEELGKEYINNIQKYNYADWYDWCCANWGTKWNVGENVEVKYNEKENEYEINFRTAWSAPVGIIIEYCKLCKDDEFKWEFVDEDGYHTLKKKNNIIYDNVLDCNEELDNSI